MHRRQYIPGSHIRLNRTTVNEQNKALRLRLVEQDEEIARMTGWHAFRRMLKRLFTAPIRLRRRVAA
jgi:hypothetical protein